MWRMDPSDTEQAYPFVCKSVIYTGHRANIFNAAMLPFSSRMCVCIVHFVDDFLHLFMIFRYSATVAGDKEVRVFDVGEAVGDGNETRYTTRNACIRVLKCHRDRVKRIITEESPDLFLTVSEARALSSPRYACLELTAL